MDDGDAPRSAPRGAGCWVAAVVCPPAAERCSVVVIDNMEWHAHKNLLPQLLAAIKVGA